MLHFEVHHQLLLEVVLVLVLLKVAEEGTRPMRAALEWAYCRTVFGVLVLHDPVRKPSVPLAKHMDSRQLRASKN